jgi:hypothetical protein
MLDQDDVEAIAQRVAEIVAPSPGRLLDARELAERLGVRRGWVYAHAALLGAVRLGEGPRAPLRFDLEQARRAATSAVAENGQPERQARPAPRSRPRGVAAGVKLIQGRSER